MSVEVEYITDMQQVMAYGVMSMPAIVINEKVVSMGKVLKAEEVKKLLRFAENAAVLAGNPDCFRDQSVGFARSSGSAKAGLILLDSPLHRDYSLFCTPDLVDGGFLPLQRLIHCKKMADFVKNMSGQISDILIGVVHRI